MDEGEVPKDKNKPFNVYQCQGPPPDPRPLAPLSGIVDNIIIPIAMRSRVTNSSVAWNGWADARGAISGNATPTDCDGIPDTQAEYHDPEKQKTIDELFASGIPSDVIAYLTTDLSAQPPDTKPPF